VYSRVLGENAGLALRDRHPRGVIADLFGVLAAIELDHQFRLQAGEVREVAIHGNLTTELEAVELAVGKREPEWDSALVHSCRSWWTFPMQNSA